MADPLPLSFRIPILLPRDASIIPAPSAQPGRGRAAMRGFRALRRRRGPGCPHLPACPQRHAPGQQQPRRWALPTDAGVTGLRRRAGFGYRHAADPVVVSPARSARQSRGTASRADTHRGRLSAAAADASRPTGSRAWGLNVHDPGRQPGTRPAILGKPPPSYHLFSRPRLEQAVAAPFATRQLAGLGARVIKVERPGAGDFARHYDRSVQGQASY
jgi:hypothetical protein